MPPLPLFGEVLTWGVGYWIATFFITKGIDLVTGESNPGELATQVTQLINISLAFVLFALAHTRGESFVFHAFWLYDMPFKEAFARSKAVLQPL